MGEKLIKFYKFANDKKGYMGKISLAQETKIPSTQAATAEDSPENIEIFKKAIMKVTGEQPPDV